MANPFIHVELMTTDVNAAKSFYGKLFDWKLEDVANDAVPGGTYTMIKVGEGTGGGLMKTPLPNGKSAWIAYVLVDDVDKAVAKAKALGGKLMKDKTEIMGQGYIAILSDPDGAMFGLWQTKS